jgi:hypothetical protein
MRPRHLSALLVVVVAVRPAQLWVVRQETRQHRLAMLLSIGLRPRLATTQPEVAQLAPKQLRLVAVVAVAVAVQLQAVLVVQVALAPLVLLRFGTKDNLWQR